MLKFAEILNKEDLVDYFEEFRNNLAKKTLKSFLKSVSKQ